MSRLFKTTRHLSVDRRQLSDNLENDEDRRIQRNSVSIFKHVLGASVGTAAVHQSMLENVH